MFSSHFLLKKLHKMFLSSGSFAGFKKYTLSAIFWSTKLDRLPGCTEGRLLVTFFPSCVFVSPPCPCPLPFPIYKGIYHIRGNRKICMNLNNGWNISAQYEKGQGAWIWRGNKNTGRKECYEKLALSTA